MFYNYWLQFGLVSTYLLLGIDLESTSLFFTAFMCCVHLIMTFFLGQRSTQKHFQAMELMFWYRVTDTLTQETYFKYNAFQ